MAEQLPDVDGESTNAGPEAARSLKRLAGFFRLMALALFAGLLVIAHVFALPWLAYVLPVLGMVAVLVGWKPVTPATIGRHDPVRANRLAPDLRLNAVLDAIPSPTILVDHRGNMIHGNAAALSALPGLRLGYPVAFALRAPPILAALDAVLAGEAESRVEFIERIPVERSFDVAIRRLEAGAVRRINGVAHAIVFMNETTAARRLEVMRADFVANASHELRTPLASILGFVETLQGPAREDPHARKTFLGIMETQARRMARLIDDLLSLSKIELNEHIPPSDRVDLYLLIRSVADALAGLARDRGVVLDLAPAADAPPVLGDRDELVRVFENLIENAIKYGQSGGRVAVSMTLDTNNPPREVTVHVQDFGPGIAEEHLPRLTERFYRVDMAESRIQGGTGLGLAIVKHIVTRHRGRLGVTSRLGKGATFSVTLPTPR